MLNFTIKTDYGVNPHKILCDMVEWGECLNQKEHWQKFIKEKILERHADMFSSNIHRCYIMDFSVDISDPTDQTLIKLTWAN